MSPRPSFAGALAEARRRTLTPVILGNNASPDVFSSGNLDRVNVVAYTVSGGAITVSELHANLKGTGNFKLVIYDSDGAGGIPSTLIGNTNNLAGPGASVTDVHGAPTAGITLTNGHTYWIGIHFGDNNVNYGKLSTSNVTTKIETGATFASGPPNPYVVSSSVTTTEACIWIAGLQ